MLFKKKTVSIPPARADAAQDALTRCFERVAFGTDVQVIGLEQVRIGTGTCVGDRVWINDCLRDEPGRVSIGKNVLIGRGAVISSAGKLEIGDFCVLGPDVFVADADHVFADPFQPILQQGVTMGRSVVIEENCWLGMNVKVFGDLTVGRGTIIGGGSIVRTTLPPFCVAVGTPARVVKLFDFHQKQWVPVRNDDDLMEKLTARTDVPDRARYREILHANYRFGDLDETLAGANHSF